MEKQITVGNRSGLDGHESARLAVRAAQFQSDIVLTANGRSVNGKDVMSILSLRAKQGTVIHIAACGPDELNAIDLLAKIIQSR